MSILVTPGSLAADYASPRTDPAILKARGHRFVVRYITGNPLSWKVLTPGERDKLFALGLGIMLVFERSAERPLGGALNGTEDGRLALRHARLLGYPEWATILVAVDIDTTAANLPLVRSYYDAFRQACAPYPTGLYGDWDAIAALGSRSSVNWQANAKGWSFDWVRRKWKGVHPLTHVLQEKETTDAAGNYDPNQVLRTVEVWNGKPRSSVNAAIPPFHPERFQFSLWPLNPRKPGLSLGSKGDAVRYLQGVLLKNRQAVKVNGIFDATTQRAVLDRQKAHGFRQTGLVDLAFWRHIDSIA